MSNVLAAALARYEKNTQPIANTPKINSDDRLKMYFGATLPKGTTSGTKRIRILPPMPGDDVFWVEKNFHELTVGKNKVKLYDPAQDGEESPLNDLGEALRATGDEMDKELAKQYRSKKFYILRVIDRDNEEDGVKFWRVKHYLRNDGPFNKIMDLVKVKKEDISDPVTGRDITLSLALLKSPQGGEYTAITSIIPEDRGPLSEDQEKVNLWLNHELTWKDAFPKKPIEYLRGVSEGYEPKWSNDLKRFVYGDVEVEETISSVSAKPSVPVTSNYQSLPVEDDLEADDDLPF